jgi:hypothetical protein
LDLLVWFRAHNNNNYYYYFHFYIYCHGDTYWMDPVGLLPGFEHACFERILYVELKPHYCIVSVHM